MFAIPLGDGGGPYIPITLNQLSATDFQDAETYKYVLSQDLDILNFSFGYAGGIENYSEQDLRNHYSKTIAALAQTGREEKTILVWAAGNAGTEVSATPSSPQIDAGLAARAEELQGHSIAVVSTREDGKISDFSNRCGIAADFCIAAPGEQVPVATTIDLYGDYYDLENGTSFAAPMVSGGLITMKKLFRDQLSNGELISRLFSTAKDDGIYSDSAIYGHGLMDLGAATNPWGIPGFMGTLPSTSGGSDNSASNCFTIFDGDCLTNAELWETAREGARTIKAISHDRIDNTWGHYLEFANALKWTAEAVNAHQAAAHLLLVHGDGFLNEEVTIGFIDSGIHEDHETFDSVSVTEEFLPGAVDEELYEYSHGTAVASVATGDLLGDSLSSPDFNINVKMFAIPLGDAGGPYIPITLNQLSASDFGAAETYKYVLSQDLDILNLSIVYQGSIENYSEQDLRNHYSKTIAALAQTGREEKTILVWAAGNVGNEVSATPSSPEILAGLAARAEELQGHSIAVVSTREDGKISDFSNHCGIAADFCIAAPGEQVLAATTIDLYGDYYDLNNGTSFAAPMVSGGLITMRKLFRDQLSNGELVSRLFSTAKDDGIYSDSAIYGHGLMDLGAATNPWGIPGFMGTLPSTSGNSLGATDAGTPITSTFMALGAPLGDGLSNALGSQEIAAFDSLGAPFWFEAASFTVPSEGVSLATRLNHFLNPYPVRSLPETWDFNFKENATSTEIGHLVLTNGASRLTMAGPQGFSATLFQDPQELAGLTLAWTPMAFSAFTVEAGYINEQQSLLGSQAEGAFGSLSGETLFLGAGLNTTAGNWQLATQGEIGQVNSSVGHSQFIDAVSSLSTSAFRLQATRPFDNGGTLSFSLGQPLRVESGSVALSLPMGRTQDGVVLSKVLSAPLAPSGRQLDLTATLEFPWLGGDVSLGATRSHQPRHQLTAAPEWTIFTGYHSTW